MSQGKANPSIGTCPCPMKDCDETTAVKQFKHTATTDQGRRYAGKLYLDCPACGRIGSDAKPRMQEWILNNGKIEGRSAPPPPPPKKSAPAPAASAAPPKPASAPSSDPPPRRPSFGFFE